MIQNQKSAMEVSAYLDGSLSPRDVVAFESRMAQDPALRRRVEETRQVVAMMRAMPLRETPRNYLISPAMVAEAKPQPATRRAPFLVMRVATSLAALAFAITSGLTLMQRGMTPAMVAQPREAPAALMSEHAPQADVATTLEAEAEGAPQADAATTLEAEAEGAPQADAAALKGAEREVAESEVAALEAPAPEGTPTPEVGLALAPAPPEGESEASGMGSSEPVVEEPAALMVAATPP
ncbi:MAG: anti-sigma factor family protein, partial [Anaerolineae bacterium]